jgi:hypothetical protein
VARSWTIRIVRKYNKRRLTVLPVMDFVCNWKKLAYLFFPYGEQFQFEMDEFSVNHVYYIIATAFGVVIFRVSGEIPLTKYSKKWLALIAAQWAYGPVAQLPGPWYTVWTDAIIRYNQIKGRKVKYVKALHDKYGTHYALR